MNIIAVNNNLMNSVTYILWSEDVDYCVLVDCGEYDTLRPVLDRIGKKVRTVLLTHGHSDHIYGLVGLLRKYPDVEVCTTIYGHSELQNGRKNLSFYQGHPFTVENYHQRILIGGEQLNFESIGVIDVFATPGHSPSCLTYRIGKDLFTGDAYIPGVKVFTKFPKSNKEQALASIEKLTQMEKDGYKIRCGHHS